jgi:hypothetical protein
MIEYLTSSYDHLFGFINLIALVLTLFFLIRYTIDTYRMANLMQESNLRPVVLRSGFIQAWNTLAPTMRAPDGQTLLPGTAIQFTILKNIAKDINGFIVVNGFKYQFLFGNDISTLATNSSSNPGRISFQPNWGWMQPNYCVYGLFTHDSAVSTTEENNIYVRYKDIEGNSYYTVEDVHFIQNTFKL